MLEKDLTPNEHVSSMFSSLVRLSSIPNHPAVIEALQRDGTLQSLIEVCEIGEIELEKYWAERIFRGQSNITDFPYYTNYAALTQFELEKMELHQRLHESRMIFVGSGAIPLTPIMFAQHYPSMQIYCIDRDPSVVQYSRFLVGKTGLENVSVHHKDIQNLNTQSKSELARADIIFIAALVGSTSEEKNEMLRRLRPYIKARAIVAIRSIPNDMRRLLYPAVELNEGINSMYNLLGTYSLPMDSRVINSLVILAPESAR